MAAPLLFRLPQELRDQIYDLALQQRRPFAQPWSKATFANNPKSSAFGGRPVAYLLSGQHGADFRLLSTIALARSCRRIRHEIELYLRIAAIDVVVTVVDFDYQHIKDFLQSLPPSALQRFTVPPESTEESRQLKVELTISFDNDWSFNLACWLSGVAILFKPQDELATAYKIVPWVDQSTLWQGCTRCPRVNSRYDDTWNRAPFHIVTALCQMHKHHQPGLIKEELFKIPCTFWGRYRVEQALKNGGVYSMGNLDQLLECVDHRWES